MIHEDSQSKKLLQWAGLAIGPVLCSVCLWLLPSSFESVDGQSVNQFSWAGRATLAVMVWMGIWWLTEAVHISVTALVPIVVFPIMGATTIQEACFPYANPLIFLYFGGFVIALAMERWGLGKRVALLTLRLVGTSASAMIAGFMVVTAVLSAFVSNTATTAMMLPIAISVVALLERQLAMKNDDSQVRVQRFAVCLLLAIAYSASIGGVMTIIGTPTNAFLIGFLREDIAEPYRMDFSFAGWLPIGASLAVVFLPVIFFMLTRVIFPIREVSIEGGQKLIESELAALGRVRRGEWNTLVVFVIAVAMWLFRPLISQIEISFSGQTLQPFSSLTDSGIAMIGAMLLFLLPVNISTREFTMDWATAEKMPWGILFLFGGGLSLAAAVRSNGVAEFIGSQAGAFSALPTIVLILVVTTGIVFLTELTSNAATTASLVPVLAALAPGLGVHPYLLIIPATVAASCAFMLPVATPPNAIVFGSGMITIPQMVRAGFLLNLLAVVLVTILTMVVVKPWLGI